MPGAYPRSTLTVQAARPSEGPPPPEPGIIETIGAGFGAARADTTGYAQEKREQAYGELIDALGELGNPVTNYMMPSRAGSGMNYTRIFADAQAMRKRNPKLFADLPETIEEFEERWRTQARESVEADEAVLARGSGVAGFIGGMAGAMTDPINVMTLPVGGLGKTALTRIGTEVLANMTVEALLQPEAQAQREALGRRDLTLGEAATNVAFAGVAAGVLRGGFEAGVKYSPQVRAAIEKALPDELKLRWEAHKLAGTDPFDDMGLMADAIEAQVPRGNMAEHESALVDVLRREAAGEAGNPFERNGAAAELHDAMMAETLARVMAENPFTPVSRPAGRAAREIERDAPGPAAPTELAGDGAAARFKNKVRAVEYGDGSVFRNPRSSAEGEFQFTDGTWLAYYKRRFGSGGLTDPQILAKKRDSRMQNILMDDLTADNEGFLRRQGEAVTEGNLYLVHFAGQGGARKVFEADPSAPLERVLGADVVRANPFLRGKTADWLIRWAAGKMGGSAPRRAGARVTVAEDSPLARNAAEAERIQQALDGATARADALADASRATREGELTVEQYVDAYIAGRWREQGAPPDIEQFAANNAAAIEAEFSARMEAPPSPLDLPDRLPEMAERAEPLATSPEVEALVPQVRTLVRDTQDSLADIDALAGRLDATADEVRAALTHLAQAGELRFVQRYSDRVRVKNRQGKWRTKTPQEIAAESGGVWSGGFARKVSRRGPDDLMGFIARQGGLEPNGLGAREVARIERDGGKVKGHDLRNTAGLANVLVPGAGPLLRPSGRSLDEMAEQAWEAGYFGPPSVVPRPSEREFLDLIAELSTSGEKRFADAAGVSRADEASGDGAAEEAALLENFRAAAAEQDPELAAGLAEEWEPVALDAALLWEQGIDPLTAIEQSLRRGYDDLSRRAAEELSDAADEIPFLAPVDPGSQRVLSDDELDALFGIDRDGGQFGEDGGAPQALRGDQGAGGGAGSRAAQGGGEGAQLAEIPAAERSPFLDPDGDAAKAQADSLEHDARAVVGRVDTDSLVNDLRERAMGETVYRASDEAEAAKVAVELPASTREVDWLRDHAELRSEEVREVDGLRWLKREYRFSGNVRRDFRDRALARGNFARLRDERALADVDEAGWGATERLLSAGAGRGAVVPLEYFRTEMIRLDDSPALDRGPAVDPALAERQRQEAQLGAEAPLRTMTRQDSTLGFGLFGAADGVRLDAEGEARPIADLLDEFDAEAADLKAIRDCL